MSNVLGTLFGDIANEIRAKTGETGTMKPAEFPEKIREISVGSGSSAELRYVTFMDDTGTVEYGKKAVAVGDDCADPIARGVFSTPTKESTAQYSYTFSGGWATTPGGGIDGNALKAVTEDKTVYANFISAVRYYTITYYDSDGVTVLKTESLAYGSTLSYVPEKEGYKFGGWSPALSAVTGTASYTAQWTESTELDATSWETIAEKSADGTASQLWKVGDTKTVPLTLDDGSTESLTVVIAGFNHDTLADGSGKAGISFVCKSAPSLKSVMSDYSYPYTTLYNYLNETMITRLPSALQGVIKPVLKPYVSSSNNSTISNSTDKLWVLSNVEIGDIGTKTDTTRVGTKYELFPAQDICNASYGVNNFPILTYSDGVTGTEFWLRTHRLVGQYRYWYIAINNTASKITVTKKDAVPKTTMQKSAVFGFCV